MTCAGGDGHQPHGVVSAQQPGQLLQPAPGKQGARGGREQRGRVVTQETCQGTGHSPCTNTNTGERGKSCLCVALVVHHFTNTPSPLPNNASMWTAKMPQSCQKKATKLFTNSQNTEPSSLLNDFCASSYVLFCQHNVDLERRPQVQRPLAVEIYVKNKE